MPLNAFHPAVAGWFSDRFGAPTPVQARAWPAIQAGRHTLMAAPTGSGKTLAAFLAAIDALVREGVARGGLPDETRVLYVSPLKALSNDIRKNLDEPLAGIRERVLGVRARRRSAPRCAPATRPRWSARACGGRRRTSSSPRPSPCIILLTSVSGREMLSTVRTVIVDELHAVADTKRGAHLALSLERLAALCRRPSPRASASRRPRSPSSGWRSSWWESGRGWRQRLRDRRRRLHPAAGPGARTAGVAARRPSCPTRSGRRSTTGSPSWCGSTAPRSSSSTPGGSRSGPRGTWRSGWARTPSRPITAAWPGSTGSTRRSA